MAGVELVGDKLLLLFYYLRIFFTFTSQELLILGGFGGRLVVSHYLVKLD